MENKIICRLCKRVVFRITKHHLIPKQKNTDGRTIEVCIPCGKQLHALFTNGELKKLDTLEKLLAQPRVTTWVAWIKNKDREDIRFSGKGGFHK